MIPLKLNFEEEKREDTHAEKVFNGMIQKDGSAEPNFSQKSIFDDSNGVQILVVDDEKQIRDILKEWITNTGYNCSEAQNAKEALTILEDKNVDVVISDIVLPDMDGLELTRVIKEKYESNVIVITGFKEDYKYEQAIKNGASDFLLKPFSLEELSIRIERVLKERFLLYEQKEAMESLRESEEKFWKLTNTAKDAIIMLDEKGNITFWNKAAEEMFGYSSREALGTDCHVLLMGQDYREAYRKGFKKFKTTGKGPIVDNWTEFMAIGKNGKEFPIELSVSATPIKGKWNSIGIIHDISARKESEKLLNQSILKLREAMGGIIHAMSLTLERRDPYTAGHQRRVSDIARHIATEMGLSKDVIECVRTSGIIHDIGKITVPAEILSKPGSINENEFGLIKGHTSTGHEILKEVDFQWPIAQIVLQHHEKIDGSGYPEGLSGDDILLEARILCVADVVEAMASHRPYRPALGIDAALEEISKNKGRLFDHDVVDTCLKCFASQEFKFN